MISGFQNVRISSKKTFETFFYFRILSQKIKIVGNLFGLDFC